MPLILGTNSIKDTGFDVSNSLRFNDDSTDYLTSPTRGTATSQKKGTFSWWWKISEIGQVRFIGTYENGNNEFQIKLTNDSQLEIVQIAGGANNLTLKTNRVFKDPASWMHVVFAVDTTQSTQSDRAKLYVNGVQETSFATNTNSMPENHSFHGFYQGLTQTIGRDPNTTSHTYDGYFAEWVYVDGLALDPTSFGEFNSDSPTIWQPIDVSGLTFGNNGYYLQFKQSGTGQNSSGLGADTSGNDNHFAVSNLTAVDQSTDTCTNNGCTLNPLYKQDHTFSEGNLGYTSSASDWDSAPGTIAASSGKYYCEMKVTATAGGTTRSVLGICDVRDANLVAESEFGLTSGTAGDNVGYGPGAVHKNNGGAGGTFASYTTDDIIGMYADLDNGKVYFSKNGAMQNSGDPTSGSTGTGAISITTGQTYLLGVTAYGGGASQSNFGSPPYAVTSGNSDPNGYGNFEYSTQNYYTLNTKNLAEFG